MSENHLKDGPTCRHCHAVYKIPALAVKFTYWYCLRCHGFNYWGDHGCVPAG